MSFFLNLVRDSLLAFKDNKLTKTYQLFIILLGLKISNFLFQYNLAKLFVLKSYGVTL